MSPTEQPKVCNSCGVDVSTGERMKDAQGRYICIPCVDRLRARKRETGAKRVTNLEGSRATAAALPPSSDQGADLREFMVQAQQAARNQCPSCGAFAPPDAVICLSCGYDSRTQGQIQTKFGRARAPKGGGGGGSGGIALVDNGALAAGAAVTWIALTFALPAWLAIDQQNIFILLIAGLLNGIPGFIMWIAWLIHFARQNSVGKAVLVGIVTLILPVGSVIGAFHFAKEGPNKIVRAFATVVLICGAILLIANLSGLTEQLIPVETEPMNDRPIPPSQR